MNVRSSVHEVDEVTRELKVSIPVEKIQQEVEGSIANLVKTSKVKGFRPGKAPADMIKKLHGERVHYEVVNRLISSSLYDVIQEHKLDMVGNPRIDVASLEPGKEIEYTANISIFPSPKIEHYQEIKVTVPKSEVTDKDVDQAIESLQKSKATPKKLEFRNKAQEKDLADISLQVQIAGEESGRPEPVVLAIGEGLLPADVEKAMVGMEIGQTKEITATIPADFPNERLREKEATFKIVLNGLSEKVLPELNDDFAKGLDLQVQTMLELRLKVRELLEKRKESEQKSEIQGKILDRLIEQHSFQVPQVLVDDEIRGLLMRHGLLDPAKVKPEEVSVEPFRQELGEIALKRVRGAIIVDRIAQQEGIKAANEDIEKTVAEIAAGSNVSVDDVRKYYLEKSRVVGFVLEITRSKVINFLTERTKVEYSENGSAEAGSEEKSKKKAAKKS